MIARVQNTSKKISYKGTPVEVWEGYSETGIRFHLFVTGTQMMDSQDLRKDKFAAEIADVKRIPSNETAALGDI